MVLEFGIAWRQRCGAEQLTMTDEAQKRIIVGISGASGIIYGVAALRALRDLGYEVHLVMTRSALVTLASEMSMKASAIEALAVNESERHRSVGRRGP
jgi:3-polyprenyl-4-hydroxybenzoate decarboxylase